MPGAYPIPLPTQSLCTCCSMCLFHLSLIMISSIIAQVSSPLAQIRCLILCFPLLYYIVIAYLHTCLPTTVKSCLNSSFYPQQKARILAPSIL